MVRPHRHDAAVGRQLVGTGGREVARSRARRTSPVEHRYRSLKRPARYKRAVGRRTPWLANGSTGSEGLAPTAAGTTASAASARLAEAGCVAAMRSIHRRTLNAYVFRVAAFQRSAQSTRRAV